MWFLAPFFLLIVIAIRIESRGNVFYRGKRVGRRLFTIYKFSAVHPGADYNQEVIFGGASNDRNLTKVGGFLKSTGMDGLPILINVIKGDMSFVGNRPLTFIEAERLTGDESFKRFLAPAGMISLSGISERGQVGQLSETERLRLEIEYADHFAGNNYSLLYDLKTIQLFLFR